MAHNCVRTVTPPSILSRAGVVLEERHGDISGDWISASDADLARCARHNSRAARHEHFLGRSGPKKIPVISVQKILPIIVPLDAADLNSRAGLGPCPGLGGPPAHFIRFFLELQDVCPHPPIKVRPRAGLKMLRGGKTEKRRK
jgi:hypothetical protein